MPQRWTEADKEIAAEVLRANRHIWWCLKCAKPRRHKYCPATAHSKNPEKHRVVLRSTIPYEQQLEFMLDQDSYDL